MKHFKYLLLLPMLTLSACHSDWLEPVEPTQPIKPTPTQPTQQHTPSLYELAVQATNKKKGTLVITPLATTTHNKAIFGLKFDPYSTALIVDNVKKIMYITATFNVTNNSNADLQMPTYIPVSLKGTLATQNGSFFRKVLNRKGQAITAIPANMNVSPSYQVSGGQIRVDSKATPFVKGLATDKLQIVAPAGSSIDRISQEGWQTTRLPKGAQQRVNFAIQVPLKSSDVTDDDPFQFSLMFTVADLP